MPLTFSGKTGNSAQFETLLEAYDGEKRVVVVSSQEAIDDHGLPAVQNRASERYDANQVDPEGRVWVLTTDL